MLLTRKRREGEPSREPSAKSRSHIVRDLIEEDADKMERYEVESEEESTSSKAPMTSRKTSMKEEGVTEKIERLKEELLAKLKSQVGAHTSLRTTSPFVARI